MILLNIYIHINQLIIIYNLFRETLYEIQDLTITTVLPTSTQMKKIIIRDLIVMMNLYLKLEILLIMSEFVI